jgi:hypothetical protein
MGLSVSHLAAIKIFLDMWCHKRLQRIDKSIAVQLSSGEPTCWMAQGYNRTHNGFSLYLEYSVEIVLIVLNASIAFCLQRPVLSWPHSFLSSIEIWYEGHRNTSNRHKSWWEKATCRKQALLRGKLNLVLTGEEALLALIILTLY